MTSPKGSSVAWGVAAALLIAWASPAGFAANDPSPPSALPPRALTTIRRMAVQDNGRQKPFDSFARETVRFITGAPRLKGQDPVETLLSIMADPEPWQETPLIWVPFIPLREALGMNQRTSHISYHALVSTRKLMRMLPPIVEKQQRDEKLSMLENEVMDVYQRFVTLNSVFEQDLDLVPPPSAASGPSWLPLHQPAGYPEEQQIELQKSWGVLITALRERSSQAIESAAAHLASHLRTMTPSAYPAAWRLQLEVAYNVVRPFGIAQFVYLLAAVGLWFGLVISRPRISFFGMAAVVLGWVIHGAGILVRVLLGGRPPVSNFYETMLWLPFVAVTVALIFERIYRVRPSTGSGLSRALVEGRYFGVAAAILAALTLSLADHLPLDSSITPVVAVLRSNLWLTVHVLTVVASYGALSLATTLAHVYGTLYLLRRGTHPVLQALDLFLYRAIQVGVVLLAGGIMLGAVWANASWGRYWGWDPKETWALITLLWFLAVLHGRFAGWLKGIGVALSIIGGFFLLLMTYYGVSFYLVGLHSYAGGHAKPLPTLLIAYLIAETTFMVVVGWAAVYRKRLPQA